ncbi:MAG: hypothetical protein ACMXX6_01655 [Candidatus Woesearchaeota archaeon]
MKKIIMALFVLALLPMLTIAQGEDEREARAMEFDEGLEVRLLQLEEAIRVNILRMDRVIENVEDSQRLEEKQRELYVVLQDVQGFEYDTRSEAIRKFTEYRRAANEISAEFRSIAADLLDEQTRAQIREDRSERERVSDLRLEITERIRAHNAQRVEEQRERLGIERAVVERIISGELRASEIRDELRRGVESSEQREDIMAQRRERQEEEAQARREAMQNAREQEVRALVSERAREVSREQITREDAQRAQALREQRAQNSNMYRVVLSEGEAHQTRGAGFTLSSFDRESAEIEIRTASETSRASINYRQREMVHDNMWVSYQSYTDDSAVFLVGFIGNMQVEQRPLHTRPLDTNREQRVVETNATTRVLENEEDTGTSPGRGR